MPDASVTSPAPRRRHGWLRLLAWVVGVVVVLLVLLYFIATSSAFFTSIVLPKAGAALDAKVTAGSASIHPFGQIVLRDLKVQTTGTEPLLTAKEVRLRYSLWAIMGGNINVDEAALVSPTVTLVENPDGTSNLDPIMKKLQQQPSQPKPPSKPSKPAQIDIKQVTLSNGTIAVIKLYAGGKRDLDQLSNVNLQVTNLKNGGTGKLTLGADIKVENNPPAPQTNGLLAARLNGSFDLGLTADLKPGVIQGKTQFEVTQAKGGLAEAAALGTTLNCNITPTEIKEVALRFQKGATRLGELLVSGPFDMEKTEGKLSVQLLNVDKNLLNLAGASSGLDFGPSTINSTNLVEVDNGGSVTTVVGQLNLNQFQVTRTNQTTPPLGLRAGYNVTYGNSNLVVRAFTLTGKQKGQEILQGALTRPMTIPLGTTSSTAAPEQAALNLTVNRLDLADWKPFIGDLAPSGIVNAKLQLVSQQGGKQLSFDLNSDLANLTVIFGTNHITGAGVTLALRGQAADMNQFTFPELRLQMTRQNQTLVRASGSASYEKSSESADVQLNGQAMLPALLQAVPTPDTMASSGTADLKAHITQKQKSQNVTGNFALNNFSGRLGSNVFRSYGATADFDIGMTPQEVQIRKVTGKLAQGNIDGGNFEMDGTYGLTNQAAALNAKLANFNQAGLGPFLQPMLGDKKLVSVALNGNAAVQYQPKAASNVKAGLSITNLVVNDPTGQIPAKPLAARMELDAGLNKDVAEIRQAVLGLTPTKLATNNAVNLTGRIDMSQPQAMSGNLKLTSEALDLTTYYDLFAAQPATASQPAKPVPQPAPSQPSAAQAAASTTSLPLTNFVADAAIGSMYLHEVQVTNLQTTASINGGKVALNPFKLWLNGAPVSSTIDLDLDVPGYKYDVTASAQAIPLAPLVNTFEPDRKGQIGGTLTADAKVAGIGTSGEDLKKNLTGNFYIGTTNLNLAVVNIRNKLLKVVINVVAVIPQMLRNPQNLLGTATTAVFSQTGGLSGDLEKSPLDKIVARGTMGSGTVTLQEAMVQSPVFQANATGTIKLQDILTNSIIDLPVSVSLSQSIAQRLNVVAPNTPTNTAYAPLPDFLTLTGTLGDPGRKINYLALAGLAARGVSGIGGTAGSILQGLGGVLGGAKSPSTNAPGTNQSSGNIGNVLQKGLGGLLGGGQSATNQPSSTNPPATNQSPIGNLLNMFGPKKK